jgi:hypothetical protein
VFWLIVVRSRTGVEVFVCRGELNKYVTLQYDVLTPQAREFHGVGKEGTAMLLLAETRLELRSSTAGDCVTRRACGSHTRDGHHKQTTYKSRWDKGRARLLRRHFLLDILQQ